MNTPRAGSVAKACTEVSTPERTRKVPSSESEKARIASRMVQLFSASRFSTTIAECSSAVAGEPGHERGVLDRVPEPPAAPAELVIGPPAAERDAEGQRDPGGQRPRPHPARPGGVDPALDQRRHRERVGGREPDIAEVEHRRVEGEARVLQDRVEAVAVERRRVEPQERVGGEQHEGQEADADQPLHARAPGPGTMGGRLRPKAATAAAEQRQDPDPEDQRALVIAPGAADLVEHRLQRMRVLGDVVDREVRRDVAVHQRGEGQRDEQELRAGGGLARRRSASGRGARRPISGSVPCTSAMPKRQHQRVVAELGDHGVFGLPALVVPVAGLLQRVGHFLGHVVLVVLGQHLARLEDAVGAAARPGSRRPVRRGTGRAACPCRSPAPRCALSVTAKRTVPSGLALDAARRRPARPAGTACRPRAGAWR